MYYVKETIMIYLFKIYSLFNLLVSLTEAVCVEEAEESLGELCAWEQGLELGHRHLVIAGHPWQNLKNQAGPMSNK